MWKNPKLLFILLGFVFLFACRSKEKKGITASEQAQFKKYLDLGDSIYATKTGYDAFKRSLIYFDSATLIAQRLQDTVMLAEGIFAKGRVYDAWNRDPEKTIECFKAAFALYQKSKKDIVRQYYIQHLIAHGYDKMKDSVNCVQTLLAMYDAIQKQPVAVRQKMAYIPQMAYISTTVKNYALAEKIMNNLYERAWVKNNPNSYNYEDFYFLMRSKIDIYKNKKTESDYLDSFALALRNVKNPLDSLWYTQEMSTLYKYTKNYEKAYLFADAYQKVNQHISNTESIESMRNQLLYMELQAARKKTEAEAEARRNKNIILWLLSVAIALTSILLFRILLISRRLEEKSKTLNEVNNRVERKIEEVQLANKEIQHRVKNNLHLIFSLLNMQERKSENPEVVANLQNARLRIESIAALHDQLSRNDNERVDFNAYIHHLIKTIINCIETEHKVIANLDIKPIDVPHNHYISIGLVLNEWITNSIKYAKVQASPLVLNISMYYQNDDAVIEYFDNGIVSPHAQTIGLGKEIITLLSQQMRATVTYKNNNPYHYFLTIKNG